MNTAGRDHARRRDPVFERVLARRIAAIPCTACGKPLGPSTRVRMHAFRKFHPGCAPAGAATLPNARKESR